MLYARSRCEELFEGMYIQNGDIIAKTCTQCGRLLCIDDFLDGKSKNLYGRKQCSRCRGTKAKWRAKNGDYNAKYYADNAEKIKERAAKWRANNLEKKKGYNAKWRANNLEKVKEKEKKQLSSFINQDKNKRFLDTVMKYLTSDEQPELDEDGFLTVRCKRCKTIYRPTYSAVRHRLDALRGYLPNNSVAENNLYCSAECKNACPLYKSQGTDPNTKHVSVFDEARDPAFRTLMLERHGNCCEICGSAENIEVHHEIPVSEQYIRSADEDNAVVVCHTCHMRMHDQPGCFLHELAQKRKQCQKNAA